MDYYEMLDWADSLQRAGFYVWAADLIQEFVRPESLDLPGNGDV